MSKAIGIDFGTTRSVAAFWDGGLKILPGRDGREFTPSVAGWHRDNIIVGSAALERMPLAPRDTIVAVRRLIGRAYGDAGLSPVERCWCEIVPPEAGAEGGMRVVLGGRQYSPIEIAALILKETRQEAERSLNDVVESAVITVPARHTARQKEATRKAAQLAGLKVLKLLDEPAAAALASGLDLGPGEAKLVLVYDFGGGGLQITVLAVAGGVFAPLSVTGDAWLGGEDLDFRIVDHVERVQAARGFDLRSDLGFMATLKAQAERAKIALSHTDRTEILIPGPLDVEVELTRALFEDLIRDDVAKSRLLAAQALEEAGLSPDDIDQVLAVGGTSLIPMVRRQLEEMFGAQKIRQDVHPLRSVAHGAALLAARLSAQAGSRERAGAASFVACVTGQHYGIRTEGGKFSVLIAKGTPFPTATPVVRRFLYGGSSQPTIEIPIHTALDEDGRGAELERVLRRQLPLELQAGTPVDVSFSLDAGGILQAEVSVGEGAGPDARPAVRGPTGRGVPDELRQKADGLLGLAEFMLDHYDWLIDPDKTRETRELTRKLRAGIESDNRDEVAEYFEQLHRSADGLPPLVHAFVYLARAIAVADARDNATASWLRHAKDEIEAAVRKGSMEEVKAKFRAIEPVLRDLLDPGDGGLTLLAGVSGEAGPARPDVPGPGFDRRNRPSHTPPARAVLHDVFRCSAFYPERIGPDEVGRIIAYVESVPIFAWCSEGRGGGV
ncbi:MAG: Hsp70 family protein, partial [Acidobacteriota bacterium]